MTIQVLYFPMYLAVAWLCLALFGFPCVWTREGQAQDVVSDYQYNMWTEYLRHHQRELARTTADSAQCNRCQLNIQYES